MAGQIPGRQGPILQTTHPILTQILQHMKLIEDLLRYVFHDHRHLSLCISFVCAASASNACLDSGDIDLYICKQISARAGGGLRLT